MMMMATQSLQDKQKGAHMQPLSLCAYDAARIVGWSIGSLTVCLTWVIENLLRMLDFNAESSGFHDAGQDSACVC